MPELQNVSGSDSSVATLTPKTPERPRPRQCQADLVVLTRTRPRLGLGWDMGVGKTGAVYFVQLDRPLPTLVVAPKSTHKTAWLADAAQFGVEAEVVWHADRTKRLEAIRRPGNHVRITNWEQFRMHLADFMAAGIKRVVFDESVKMKNRQSNTFVAAAQFADRMEEVYLLSGNPAPNCPTEYWAQMRVMSKASVPGEFFAWANRWFFPIQRTIKGKLRTVGWKLKPAYKEAFHAHLRNWWWILRKEDVLDLPAQFNTYRTVELSDEERKVYNGVLKELKIAIPSDKMKAVLGGDLKALEEVSSVSANAATMKLRQICAGFVLVDGVPKVVGDSKLQEVLDVVSELGPRPILIWGEFRYEIERLAEALTAAGRKVATVYGGSKGNVGDTVQAFMDGKIDTIVGHPASMGHGTNGLQKVCSVEIFSSLGYSADQHDQARSRLHRGGQSVPVQHIYITVEDSTDEGCLAVCQRKINSSTALLRELKRPTGSGKNVQPPA